MHSECINDTHGIADAVDRFFLEKCLAEGGDIGGELWVECREGCGWCGEVFKEDGHGRALRKGRGAREDFMEDAANGVEVCACVDRFAANLFRGDVVGGASLDASALEDFMFNASAKFICDAKVDEDGIAILIDDNILWF